MFKLVVFKACLSVCKFYIRCGEYTRWVHHQSFQWEHHMVYWCHTYLTFILLHAKVIIIPVGVFNIYVMQEWGLNFKVLGSSYNVLFLAAKMKIHQASTSWRFHALGSSLQIHELVDSARNVQGSVQSTTITLDNRGRNGVIYV